MTIVVITIIIIIAYCLGWEDFVLLQVCRGNKLVEREREKNELTSAEEQQMARKPSPTLGRDTQHFPRAKTTEQTKRDKKQKNQCKSLVKIWFRVSFHLAVRPSAGSQTAADCERTKVITQHRRKKIISSSSFTNETFQSYQQPKGIGVKKTNQK